MSFIKTHPVFFAIMALLGMITLGEVWQVWSGGRAQAEIERRVSQRITEIERPQRQTPTPTDANVRAARDDLAQNAEVLATMLRMLNVTGADDLEYFKGEPASRTDAYFDIAQFVEAMRKEAAQAGVELRTDEYFGFSAYANEGPEPEIMRSVYRQRRIVEYLLRALFVARPRALVGVQREEPRRLAGPDADANGKRPSTPSPASRPTSNGSDLFVVNPQVSARTPDYVDTLAFRVTFAGQTTALRGFINALAAPDLPLVVRSVEVEPMSAEPARAGASGSRSGRPGGVFGRPGRDTDEPPPSTVPIVAENDSRFTVTIEFFEVLIRPPATGS